MAGEPIASGMRPQRSWTGFLDLELQRRVLSSSSEADRARLSSCSAAHASAYLVPKAGAARKDSWYSPSEFVVLIRHRLGLPVAASEATCTICHELRADVLGRHSLCCRHGLERKDLHNVFRNELTKLASLALTTPRLEQVIGVTDSRRIDVVLGNYRRAGRQVVVDVMVTFPLQTHLVRHAIETPGGAATYQERLKHDKYDGLCAQQGLHLVPALADTFGAFGAAGLELLRELARRWGSRIDVHPSAAIPLALGRINVAIMRGVARLLLCNAQH
jgi:hypothetical protein